VLFHPMLDVSVLETLLCVKPDRNLWALHSFFVPVSFDPGFGLSTCALLGKWVFGVVAFQCAPKIVSQFLGKGFGW